MREGGEKAGCAALKKKKGLPGLPGLQALHAQDRMPPRQQHVIRGGGLSLRLPALPRPALPLPRRALREMLSELRDPYSRFVSPADFTAMLKYDVSGVGLNLGTAGDLEAKTVRGRGREAGREGRQGKREGW